MMIDRLVRQLLMQFIDFQRSVTYVFSLLILILMFGGTTITHGNEQRVSLNLIRSAGGKADSDKLTVELMPAEFRRRVVRHLRTRDTSKLTASLRYGVKKEDIQQALRLARQAMPGFDAEFKELEQVSYDLYFKGIGSEADYQRRLDQQMDAYSWAARILSVAGNEQDAARLLSGISSRTHGSTFDMRLELVAQMESRLGTLGDGATIQLLQHSDKSTRVKAAVHLHRLGIDAGTQLLVDVLSDPKEWLNLKEMAARELCGDDSPEVLKAMRTTLRATLAQPPDYIPGHASLAAWYLLALGDAEDRRLASQIQFDSTRIELLTYIVKDRRKVVGFFLGLGEGQTARYDLQLIQRMYAVLDLLPDNRALQVEREFTGLLLDAAVKSGAWQGVPVDAQRKATAYSLAVARSYNRPNLFTASCALEGQYFYHHRDVTWIPRRANHVSKLVDRYLAGDRQANSLLFDYVDHETFKKLLAEHSADQRIPGSELLIAYHAIATRAHRVPERFPQQAMHRAFALWNEQHSGMISGVMEVLPQIQDGKLRVAVRLDLRAGGSGTLISRPEQITQGIPRTGRIEMIQQLHVHDGTQWRPLQAVEPDASRLLGGADRGDAFWFEIDWPHGSLDHAHLHLDFRYLDQDFPFDFSLYSSDAAREMRRSSAAPASTKH